MPDTSEMDRAAAASPAARGSASPTAHDIPLADRLTDAVAWLHAHQRAILLAAAGFQLLVLVAMIVKPATTLATGETVLVRVRPVDPRDLFRGDYVILSYDFNGFDPDKVAEVLFDADGNQIAKSEILESHADQPIYALLAKDVDGRHQNVVSFTFARPTFGQFLAGTLQRTGRIEYGIESFFVQEGTGRAYEDAVRNGNLSAELAVDPDGNAVLKRLVIE